MNYLMNAKRLRIDAGVTGCFSATSYQVEIDAREDPCPVCVTGSSDVGGTPGQRIVYRVPREMVDSFIGAVATIIGTPERLIGDRSTTVYHAKVDASDVPGFQSINTRSSEIPKAMWKDFLDDEKTSVEVRQKIVAMLPHYHNWAHELFEATEAFIARCRTEVG